MAASAGRRQNPSLLAASRDALASYESHLFTPVFPFPKFQFFKFSVFYIFAGTTMLSARLTVNFGKLTITANHNLLRSFQLIFALASLGIG
jgi:hypothetical protein